MPFKNLDVAQLARNHSPFLRRLNFMKKLEVHDGCVNTISWNKTGEYILSGSDDRNLCITKPTYLFDSSKDYTVLHKVQTHHLGNIFCARFMPNTGDTKIVSCSSNGPVIVHDIYAPVPSEGIHSFNCHTSTIYDVVPVPDNDCVFLSCSEDKTIRIFDMRVHTRCSRPAACPHPTLIRNSHAITTLTLHPLNSNLMLVGRADGVGLVYDRRRLPDVTKFSREVAHAELLARAGRVARSFKYMHPMDGVVGRFQVPDMKEKYRFTSLCYNKNGSQALASYSGEYLYLFNHDASSNIELVQTLNQKSATSSSQNPSINSSNSVTSGSDGQPTTASNNRRYPQISRIRVRGDWSDTGVDSVPHSRSGETSSRSRADATMAFLDYVAISLRSRNSVNSSRSGESVGSARTHVPVEIIAGPIVFDASSNHLLASERSSSQTSRQESVHEEDDDDEDDDEHSDDDHDYEYTVVYDMNNEDQRDNNTEDDTDESATAKNQNGGEEGKSSDRSGGGHSGISEAKAKFRKTFDGLKAKYSQIPTYRPRVKYQGHRNSRTSIKKAIFWGDKYVMSGSDCGRIMVWDKESAELKMAFQADKRVVNCLEPNPHHYVLATSGIDYDIKLWSTQGFHDGPLLISDGEMNRIIENNELMLEQTKNTFTVPPYYFYRILERMQSG